jgi:hypothetical protein
VVAALDLAEDPHPDLAALGRARLDVLAPLAQPAWHRRPARPRPQRPIVPTGARPRRSRLSASARFETIWDDRAEQDACGLVALLFVAAGPLRPRRGGRDAAHLAGTARAGVPERPN